MTHGSDSDRHSERMAAVAVAIAATPINLMESWRAETAEWEAAELAYGGDCNANE